MDKLVAPIPFLLLLLLVGALACLPMYKGDVRRFMASTLFTKIIVWVPLYGLFLIAVSNGWLSGLFVGGLLGVMGMIECYQADYQRRSWWYVALFLIGCVAWPYSVNNIGVTVWMAYCLASVFSDVMAYFFGTYAGRHHLPPWINIGKSYEGIFGQLVGGIVGVFLFGALFGVKVSLLLGLLIGIASTFGDLANSLAKRRVGIKDWGSTIPGHGGVMDRFSSLNIVLIITALGLLSASAV